MAWHAYNLLSATVFNEYYGVHLIPQGSAYLFSHGADGAPRDQGLFVIPLTYLRPALARETLQLIMRLTHADSGEIPYAFAGYGIHDGAGVHDHPSDLDLFFLLGLCEYLAATGDVDFLNSVEPYYPHGSKTGTVLDHACTALHHLMFTVGLGPHGLLRVSDGDWSDSIVLETALKNIGYVSYEKTVERGESIPNSQMALYVLPHIAAIVQPHDSRPGRADAELCETPRRKYGGHVALARLVCACRLAQHHRRADFLEGRRDRSGSTAVGLDQRVVRSSQSNRSTDRGDRETSRLAFTHRRGLDSQRHGLARRLAGLLTWGYARHRPDLAWRSLRHNTFAEHARRYPEVWINVWSGPDGVNSSDGRTWVSPLTPMTDFPVMNANQDALALLGLLRVCGIEPHPSGDGLIIAPQAPPERFVLDLPLLRLEVEPNSIKGEYRAVVRGDRVLHVHAPRSATNLQASVNGQALQIAPTDGEVPFHLKFDAHDVVAFEVRWENQARG